MNIEGKTWRERRNGNFNRRGSCVILSSKCKATSWAPSRPLLNRVVSIARYIDFLPSELAGHHPTVSAPPDVQ
jgi:hypothetical protein